MFGSVHFAIGCVAWEALSATATVFIWHSITCSNVQPKYFALSWIECWDETLLLWHYIKKGHATLIYASIITTEVLVYLKFSWSIHIFTSQSIFLFLNIFCPIKVLSVRCCPERAKWLISTTTSATKYQTATSMHVRCICVILVGLRRRRWGWGSESCEQTNERQAQIQPQVADAEPRAYRGVSLL